MFIISINYVSELSEVDKHVGDHVAYLRKYYALGRFLLSGRKNPRTGGIILVNGASLDEVNEIIKEDPFYKKNLAEYEVTEFMPSMATTMLEQWVQIP